MLFDGYVFHVTPYVVKSLDTLLDLKKFSKTELPLLFPQGPSGSKESVVFKLGKYVFCYSVGFVREDLSASIFLKHPTGDLFHTFTPLDVVLRGFEENRV